MGLRNFFSKMGQGLAKAGRWIGGKVVDGAKWVGKHAKPILSGVLNTLKGSGGIIGTLGGLGENILNGFKKSAELIPNQDIRRKATEYIDKGSTGFNKLIDGATSMNNKIQPYVDKSQEILNM